MRGFRYRHGTYRAEVDETEVRVLSGVVADTARLLGADITGGPGEADGAQRWQWSSEGVEPPSDPALARLLPPAREQEDEAAAEFRRLTQADLRGGKVERLRQVWIDLRLADPTISVPADRAMDWAAALTDVRLVLAQRLGIETDDDAEQILSHPGQDELAQAMISVYSALSWLQDSLMTVMARHLG